MPGIPATPPSPALRPRAATAQPVPEPTGIPVPASASSGPGKPDPTLSMTAKDAFTKALDGLKALEGVQLGGRTSDAAKTSLKAAESMLQASLLLQLGRSRLAAEAPLSSKFDANLVGSATQLAFIAGQIAGSAPIMAAKKEQVPLTSITRDALGQARTTAETALFVLEKAARDARPGVFSGYL